MAAPFLHSQTHTNALIHEKSPYLLQHAHNPVNWFAWNDETFARAVREDKPIFLSIGYATCHWCHVMERESFENTDIADYLNEHYIAVKVDREERPDIDAIYMRVCQAMTGHGGWPLTIFMNPSKQPFFAGTYFPPENYHNRPGFPHIIQQIFHAWKHEREKIEESCAAILEHFTASSNQAAAALPEHTLPLAFQRYEQSFDPQFGGFGSQPKFPSPQNLLFLLRYYKRTGESSALAMVERTLRAMRKGGIFDHIGYGFHRYSTDREWLLPHFEKMLYDQAMLAVAFLETHQATDGKDPLFAQVAEEIFTYVLRDMTSPEGGFYSAEDADSEGHEGKFYVWSTQELVRVLGEEDAALFAAAYNVREDGNFHDEATGAVSGENIPHLRLALHDFAQSHAIDEYELRARLSVMRERLFNHRETRIHPLKDDKILADWNGLMIAAFAIGGRVLDNALYTQAAERSLSFILETMSLPEQNGTKRLLHRYRTGEAAIPAFLDDYAFLAHGALELYQTTFNIQHLKTAQMLADEMIRLFYDTSEGGFHFSAADNEALLMQTKEGYDGAIPSGNSIAASVLARLGKLTSNRAYQDCALRTIERFAAQIQHHPTGFAQMLMAHDFLTGATQEIIIAGRTNDSEIHAMLRLLAEQYAPHSLMVFNHSPQELKHCIEQTEYQISRNNQATAYICENFTCQEPIMSSAALKAVLQNGSSVLL